MSTKRGSFSGSIGFILASAGSAIGLGNLWRFPYLAAKDGGGLFVAIYIVLALTFGFSLMLTEFAIGRKTGASPLEAYGRISKRFGFLGWIATLAPAIIFPYYCVIGGWVTKYTAAYISGEMSTAVQSSAGFFEGFLASPWDMLLWFLVFMALSAVVVVLGVEKGIERASKLIMPALLLLIVGIAIFSLTLSYTDPATGETRTAIDGLKIYLVPSFSGMTLPKFLNILVDAVGQLFYSLSIAMGILVTYGSYSQKDGDLVTSVHRIEIFDSAVAILAGIIIIPAVFVFQGYAGLSSSGPGLMFISLPAIFSQMGGIGNVIGALFFLLVLFAALTSSISLLETVTASIIDRFHIKRTLATALAFGGSLLIGAVVCLGYNVWRMEIPLPNGTKGQFLDVLDYASNSLMLPVVALLTCIMIGWVCGSKTVTDEVAIGSGEKKFRMAGVYRIMIRYVCPVLLLVILLQAFRVF